MSDMKLLLEQLERLAIVLDEIMPMTALVVRNAIALLKKQEAIEPYEAAMMITHDDGSVEYLKDIDSVMLLAHMDYQITYTGEF